MTGTTLQQTDWVKVTHHNPCDVACFKLADCQIQRFLHIGIDALCDELVEVDGSAQQLDVSLF